MSHSRLTPAVQARICEALRAAAPYDAAAKYAGVPRRTFYRWLEKGRAAKNGRYRDSVDALEKARDDVQVACAAVWRKAAMNDWRAARSLLQTRFPEDWAKRDRVELSGKLEHRGNLFALPPERDDDESDADKSK